MIASLAVLTFSPSSGASPAARGKTLLGIINLLRTRHSGQVFEVLLRTPPSESGTASGADVDLQARMHARKQNMITARQEPIRCRDLVAYCTNVCILWLTGLLPFISVLKARKCYR
ncbi:unnamed protein product [Tuber aestivum]|uniref:Uncharacterized protein n=1 Tax=Tuber aestivum TaxID=59557 RepID=A0A292Q107_9PEZI|nr:unnamed protein product [Tuber aestivum]